MADRVRPDLAKLLDGRTDLEKVQAAKDVAATMQTPGWALFVQLLETRRAQLLEQFVQHVAPMPKAESAERLGHVRELDVVLDVGASVLQLAERARLKLTEGAS